MSVRPRLTPLPLVAIGAHFYPMESFDHAAALAHGMAQCPPGLPERSARLIRVMEGMGAKITQLLERIDLCAMWTRVVGFAALPVESS